MILATAAALLTASPGPANNAAAYLVIDKPLHRNLNGIAIDYDGNDRLKVRSRSRLLDLGALAPAQLSVSPTRQYLAHGFGNGSGQIYDVQIFSLTTGRRVSVSGFKQRVLSFARSRRTCRARLSQISFLVERWTSAHALQIGTEDWTRRPGCGHLHRKWTLNVR